MQGSSEYNDQCCNYITNRIGHSKYEDIIEWLNDDFDNIEEIVNNYINIFYQRDYSECQDLEKLTIKSEDTKKAMVVLDVI